MAQGAPPKVLEDNQVTEKNLLDALTPTAEELEGIRTRSLRVGPASGQVAGTQAGAAAVAPAAQRRDVSLLVTFITNSAALTNRAQQLLDVVGRALKSDQLAALKFTVEGHADPRGNHQANLALSQARAESVRKYLIATHGIEDGRLFAVGKGDKELLNKATPTAPENRRVTLVTRME
jgi:outer membrane protein OmpA-like peptidoglycan-associated protein